MHKHSLAFICQGKLRSIIVQANVVQHPAQLAALRDRNSFRSLQHLTVRCDSVHHDRSVLDALLRLLTLDALPALESIDLQAVHFACDCASMTHLAPQLKSLAIHGVFGHAMARCCEHIGALTALTRLALPMYTSTDVDNPESLTVRGAVSLLTTLTRLHDIVFVGLHVVHGVAALSAFTDLTRLALRFGGYGTLNAPLSQSEYEHGAWLAGALSSLTSLKSLSVAAHLKSPRHDERFTGTEFLAVLPLLQDVLLDLELTNYKDDDDVGAPALTHEEQELAKLRCLVSAAKRALLTLPRARRLRLRTKLYGWSTEFNAWTDIPALDTDRWFSADRRVWRRRVVPEYDRIFCVVYEALD